MRTGTQKPPGPCPPELQRVPFLQGAAFFFMNIHDISILETQSPEKLRHVSCRCDAAGSLRPSPSPQDPAGCGGSGRGWLQRNSSILSVSLFLGSPLTS